MVFILLPFTDSTADCDTRAARLLAEHTYVPRWNCVTTGISSTAIFFPILFTVIGSGSGPDRLSAPVNVQTSSSGMSPLLT